MLWVHVSVSRQVSRSTGLVSETLGVDAADPIPPDSEVAEEFVKRGVLVWRDTFASV